MGLALQIQRMAKKLYPNGRAWFMPTGANDSYVSPSGDAYVASDGSTYYITSGSDGYFSNLHYVMGVNAEQTYNDSVDVLDAILADNSGFDVQDAERFESLLGISASSTTTLENRMYAIMQKYTYPQFNEYVQHVTFIQSMLRNAGFDVYVYENREWDGTQYLSYPPTYYNSSVSPEPAIYGVINYGETNYGTTTGMDKVVNYIEADKDAVFSVGGCYSQTFFIGGGGAIGNYANVPATREAEFRQLILSLKQATAVAFLFVNYV